MNPLTRHQHTRGFIRKNHAYGVFFDHNIIVMCSIGILNNRIIIV
jgi:hypothetical protein